MARGRHARRPWWRALLSPASNPAAAPARPAAPHWRDVHALSLLRLSDDVAALQAEVTALRGAFERSTAAEVAAELRAQRLEEELAAARTEVTALRRDLDALREDVVWAFAERRLPGSAPQRLSVARRSG